MKKLSFTTSLVIIFVAGIWCVAQDPVTTGYSAEMTLEQSLPILRVLSKVHPIVTVNDNPYNPYGALPHFCWIMAKPGEKRLFAPVARILGEAETESQWFMTYEVPYFCIFAQPRDHDSHPIAWPIDPRSISRSDLIRLRERAVREIPALSKFIEDRLNLGGKEILGLDVTGKDLAHPGITDYSGPHNKNIFLAADPRSFSPYLGTVTSDYDRMLHYGLTDEEALSLESAVQADTSRAYMILPRFFYRPYEEQRVLPTEIPRLKDECTSLKLRTNDKAVVGALDKLLSVALSAEKYDLGLYLDSD